MRIKNQLIVLVGTVAVGSLFLLPLVGCEDADARERVEMQSALTEASAQYRQATVASVALRDENVETARQELDAVIRSLEGITGGEPGQQAAAAVLAADARLELAAINMQEAKITQLSLARKRSILHNQIDGMKLLTARAEGRDQTNADEFIASSRQLKERVEDELRELQRSIEELDSPIAELERMNEEDRQQVQQLREETNELLRRAAELGHADGFDHVKEAAAARREADRLERRASMRDIELEHEKRPQFQLIQHRVRNAQALIDALEATLDDLEAFEEVRTGDIRRLQESVSKQRSSIEDAVREITDRQSGDLDPLYEEAEELLQRAVNSIGRATGQLRGEDAVFARLAAMRSHEMLGELYWSRARGVSNHAKLLAALVEAGELVGQTDAYETELHAARTLVEQLLQSAEEAYQQALNNADQITGPAADAIRPTRDRLEQFTATFAEVHGDAPTAGAADATATATPDIDPGSGFESADALLAFLEEIDGSDMDALRRLTDTFHAQTSTGQAELQLMRTLFNAMFDLEDAMQETFGVGMDTAMGDMPGMDMGDISPFGPDGFTIVEQTDSRIVIETEGAFGESEMTELVEIDGRWYISMDPTDDDEMDEMAMEMIEQIFGAMADAMSDLANRIRAGAFESPEQVGEALQQEMMQGMGAPGQGF